ncbi:MAG TPA: hypothetical protein VH165_24760 [Kofleriaceae bacterium]|nr:hypothetical protein [Kofleriaceae bacterium]
MLEGLLGKLPVGTSDDERWHDEVLQLATKPAAVTPEVPRLATKPATVTPIGDARRRRTWIVAGLAVAAAAGVLLILTRDRSGLAGDAGPLAMNELRVTAQLPDGTRRTRGALRDAAATDVSDLPVNTEIVVDARPNGSADIRIYRSDGKLVAQCPNGPQCQPIGDQFQIRFKATGRSDYDVIQAVGIAPLPASLSLAEFLDAARKAGADISVWPTIGVH